jgi:hypothetical protein
MLLNSTLLEAFPADCLHSSDFHCNPALGARLRVPRDTQIFQHIASSTHTITDVRGNRVDYLRTVIVTAAVYWGLVSVLRASSNTST